MALLDTTCPACAAPHARKLSLIYEEGRISSSSTTHSVGKTNTIAQISVTTKGTTYGVQQSDASAAAAPPPVPPLISSAKRLGSRIFISSCTVAMVIPFAFYDQLSFFKAIGLALLLMVFGMVAAMICGEKPTQAEIDKHANDYREAYSRVERWKNTFACSSCGHRFVPVALDPKLVTTASDPEIRVG